MIGWWLGTAAAADPEPEDVEEVTVEGEAVTGTATERTLDRGDVESFPARSADELLRAMPGLHLSAHGGTGKAFQFLVRGFDAEHGSDLRVAVEGVPMNEPSNVHGHGYLDLHFLPSVLVDGLDLVKGSYRAEDGDFAITGSADYRVGLAPEGLQLATSAGTDRSGSGTVAWRPRGAGSGTFVVLDGEGAIGVGDGRRYTQVRAAAGVDGQIGATSARVMAFVYDGTFASPGVLRTDDLLDGEIGFYGAYPESGGGASRRALGIGELASSAGDSSVHAVGWLGGRTLRLDQNFSGYLRDEVHGDGTRQTEVAGDVGARVDATRLLYVLKETWAVRGGAEIRATTVSETEQGLTPDGAPWEDRLDSGVRQLDAALWSEGRAVVGDRLTLIPGIRADRLELALNERRDASFAEIPSPTWARSGATVVSPKGTASLSPVDPLTVFAAWGRGFRSPDARGIADGDRAPVMKSTSAEAGLKLGGDLVSVQATGFEIVVSDELVFDHLAGRFLSAGRTRRLGLESVVDARPLRWLRLQADLTYTDGRFTATNAPIPYAPRWLAAGGAFAEGAKVAGGALTGGVRAWYLGPRPLPAGFASHPSLVGSLTSKLQWDRASVGVDVDDLFLGPWRDGEFVYPSWFDRTEPRSELKVLHVTAGDPFAVRVQLGIRI